jgi:hypothetical protein
MLGHRIKPARKLGGGVVLTRSIEQMNKQILKAIFGFLLIS